MSASRWNIKYSINLPSRPTQEGVGWFFNLKKDVSEVDYVLCDVTAPITTAAISMTAEITCGPTAVFDSNNGTGNIGGIPPSFRFILLKDVTTEFGRWFCSPFIELKPGTNITTLRVPFDLDKWSSVYGKVANFSAEATNGFKKVLASPASLGMCFGGGNFYGHGIRVHNSDAKIKILNYSLTA